MMLMGGLLNSLLTIAKADQTAKIAFRGQTDKGLFSAMAFQIDFTPVATVYLPIVINEKPPATPTPLPTSTPVTLACNPTQGSGGLEPGIYVTTVAGLNASVIVGQGYKEGTPTYLSFHIHGDNGKIWKSLGEKPSDVLTKFVSKQGWILVAPQSPNNGYSWWANQDGDHAEKFKAVLDEMFAKYNVCRDTVFGSSGSGGSVFWTGEFFPEKGADYPAYMSINCGASGASNNLKKKISELSKNTKTVDNSRLYYIYGENDTQVSAGTIEANLKAYKDAGFKGQGQKLLKAGHCNQWDSQGLPNQRERIVEVWTLFAQDLGIK